MIDRQILWWGGAARHPCGDINQLRLYHNSNYVRLDYIIL